jgi:glycosyltransferase involved in cell wall biosynthesis
MADVVPPPLVSICIPTYNRPEYLRRAVESCLAQTYSNFDVIITDNSTNMDSATLAATWTDPRVRYYKNEGNIGTEGSINRGVALSGGQYIKFLMDDDLLKPRCLELMVAALENHPTAGLAMAPMDLINEEDRRIFPRFYVFRTMAYRYRYQVGDALIGRRRILKDFLTRDYPCTVPTGIMFRKEALRRTGEFTREADFAGDLHLCMKVAVDWDFYYIDQVLSSFRYVDTSHTARLHREGLKIEAWYYVTRQCLGSGTVRELFPDNFKRLERDSLLFCTLRAVALNGIAGARSRRPQIWWHTARVILREDRWSNVLRLPSAIVKHIFTSFFPPKLPPPRE